VPDVTQVILAKIHSLPVVAPTTITAIEGDPLRMRCTQIQCILSVTNMWGTVNLTTDSNFVHIILSSRISVSDEGNLYFAYATVDDNLYNRFYAIM
jgi:hypothetical protein